MKAIRTNAEQVLRENFENTTDMTFAEYVSSESNSDPNFFRWLFNEEFENDFDSDLTDEQKETFNNFLTNCND